MWSVIVFLTALVLLFLPLALILKLYLSWNFDYWKKRHVSGPAPQLLKGTFPKTTAGKCNLMEELHEIYLRYKVSHRYVGIFNSCKPKLFILDPKLATQILTQSFKSFHDNESSQWTSPNVEQMRLCSPFVSIGDTWKERRSELVPALTVNRVRACYGPMRDSAAKLVKFIEACSGKPLDAKQLTNRFTAHFMANFIWGIEEDAYSHNSLSAIHQMANSIISQALDCVRYYERTAAWPWLRKFRSVRFFPESSDRFFRQLTVDALEMRAKSSLERCDVINHLLQLRDKKPLSDVQIAGHTTTVLIDGFETVALVAAHCLLLLSRNPRVQQKLRQQLMTAGENITYDELNELPYLDQCLQETMRICPPLLLLSKLCTENITLENFDNTPLKLQPGDCVYISSYSFHRDADFFENPEDYWPERFDEELGGVRKYRDMGVFLPFGDGPRICPGTKLGLAEAKVAVAEIVRHFKLKCSPPIRMDNKIAADSFLLILDGNMELIFEKL